MKKALLILLLFIHTLSFGQKNEVDSMERLLPKVTDTLKAKVLSGLCKVCQYVDPAKALKYGEEAVVFSKKIKSIKYEAAAYENLGLLAVDRSEYENAEAYFQKALKIYVQLNDKRSQSEALGNIGITYDYRGDMDKTLEYYTKGLELSKEVNDSMGVAASLYNIGNVYNLQGNYGKAMSNWHEALKTFEKINEKEGMASVYLNLGLMYKKQNNFAKGLEYYKMAEKIAEEIEELSLLSDVDNNIGVLYLENAHDYDQAYIYFIKGLEISKKLNDDFSMAATYLNIGEIKFRKEKFPEAFDDYNKALKIFREIGEKDGEATALTHLGNCCNGMKQYDKAISYCLQSIVIAKEKGYKEELDDIYTILSDSYARSGNYQKALESHILLANSKDSIFAEKNGKNLVELQSKYDSDKKQKEIEILEQKNDIQLLDLKRKRIIIYSAVGALLLLIIMSLVVYNRYQIKQRANVLLSLRNKEIQFQKEIIQEKNKDITDSIVYAKRIQDAILPSQKLILGSLPEHFILFRPKDIVSGDFYFFEKLANGSSVIAAVDCTGHGVPGAFMSIVGYNALNQSINEQGKTHAAEILGMLNNIVSETLQHSDATEVKDGMDISLCVIDHQKMKLEFSGAINSLYHLRNGILREVKADKLYIGNSPSNVSFTNHEIDLQKGDVIYLYSDGFADQFGGPKGKKFKYKPLQELLVSISSRPMPEQHHLLNTTIEAWKGDLEQLDDILIFGVRII